jgi:hypothetical protein
MDLLLGEERLQSALYIFVLTIWRHRLSCLFFSPIQ